jgi:hypothetical protein
LGNWEVGYDFDLVEILQLIERIICYKQTGDMYFFTISIIRFNDIAFGVFDIARGDDNSLCSNGLSCKCSLCLRAALDAIGFDDDIRGFLQMF